MDTQRRVSSFVHHWNRWVAVIIFLFALWGLLAFFDMGGYIGLEIIGGADFLGALRLLGIVIIGVIFVTPCWSFGLLGGFSPG